MRMCSSPLILQLGQSDCGQATETQRSAGRMEERAKSSDDLRMLDRRAKHEAKQLESWH